jgi:ribosomal small subunit protein bTHX
MGKGDKRTRRGKISNGSFGKYRMKKKNTKKVVIETPPEPAVETKAEE